MSNLLEIRDLVTNFYTYEGVVKALNHVSLDIEKDTIFGLVGESGCGKSVTVRSIMRIVQPPGKIEKGFVVHHINGEKLDNRIENLMAMPRKEHIILHNNERIKNNPQLKYFGKNKHLAKEC